ncbi:MAG: hypothetical protein IKX23_01490 [Treponema sp.]|nr:hypothetical protein [Treponema sp.]
MKRFFLIVIILFIFNFVFAQNEKIELPELTTVVSTNSVDEENVPVPDFNDVVSVPEGSGELVPKLPEINNGASGQKSSDNNQKNKNLFLVGTIGGGYPSSITGSFSVTGTTENPFKLVFSHDSANGYASKSVSNLFNHRNNLISLDKTFKWNKFSLNLSGGYEDNGNGLQSKTDNIASVNQDFITASFMFDWSLTKDWNLETGLSADYYFRFVDIASSSVTVDDWIKFSSDFNLNPFTSLTFASDSITAGIDFTAGFAENFVRTCVQLDFSYKNDVILLNTSAAYVFSKNAQAKNIFPFKVSLDSYIPIKFADRPVSISLSGGLDSSAVIKSQLEKDYKFTACSLLSTEQTDWFGAMNVSFPIMESFTAETGMEFRATAFDNYCVQPDYTSSSLVSGLYGFKSIKRNEFDTNIKCIYKYKIFTVTALWNTCWIEVPALKNENALDVNLSLQDKDAVWGADIGTLILLAGEDKTPVLNLECFVKVSDSMKLVLRAEDVLKLFSASERIYAGQYIGEGGNVKLTFNFVF